MAWPVTIPTDYATLTTPSASDLNTGIAGMEWVGGSWAAYTPTFQGGTSDPGGTIVGRQRLTGHTLEFAIRAISTGATDGNGIFLFGLPSGITLTGSLQSQVVAAGMRAQIDSLLGGSRVAADWTLSSFAVPHDSTRMKVAIPSGSFGDFAGGWVTHTEPWDSLWTEVAYNTIWIAGTLEVD